MLIPDNIHPKYTLYYNGAMILQVLQIEKNIHFMDLYIIIRKKHDMTFPLFTLSLDWLFLIDLAHFDSNGFVNLVLRVP